MDVNTNELASMGEDTEDRGVDVPSNSTDGECIIGALCQIGATAANFDLLWRTCSSASTAGACTAKSTTTGSCCWSPSGPSASRACESQCGPVTPLPTPAPAPAQAHIVRITSYTDLKCIDLPRPHFYKDTCSGCNVNSNNANCTTTLPNTCPWVPPSGSIASASSPFVYTAGELARVSEACAGWCHNREGTFVGAVFSPGPSVDINNYGATNICSCLSAVNFFLTRAVPTENLDLILTHDGPANCPR